MLFMIEEYDIASYVDNNTTYSGGETTENATVNLEKLLKNLFQWFYLKGALSGLRRFLATENPLKMMNSAFYFTSKALFVLKIFKFLS